ncbi:hypothetical protein VNO77_19154 [Canavalia gladiata]|uniref:Secreted protein n=1 Tax=Canavalia gladiata TaxID=3824 RepID=A0AAN9QL44_CANGL
MVICNKGFFPVGSLCPPAWCSWLLLLRTSWASGSHAAHQLLVSDGTTSPASSSGTAHWYSALNLLRGAQAISRASCFSWCDLRVGCDGSRQRSGWPERGSVPPLQQVSGSCSELEFPRFWPSGLAQVWVKPPPCSVTPIPARRTFEFTGSLVRLGEKRWRDNGSSGVRDAIPKVDGGELSIG